MIAARISPPWLSIRLSRSERTEPDDAGSGHTKLPKVAHMPFAMTQVGRFEAFRPDEDVTRVNIANVLSKFPSAK